MDRISQTMFMAASGINVGLPPFRSISPSLGLGLDPITFTEPAYWDSGGKLYVSMVSRDSETDYTQRIMNENSGWTAHQLTDYSSTFHVALLSRAITAWSQTTLNPSLDGEDNVVNTFGNDCSLVAFFVPPSFTLIDYILDADFYNLVNPNPPVITKAQAEGLSGLDGTEYPLSICHVTPWDLTSVDLKHKGFLESQQQYLRTGGGIKSAYAISGSKARVLQEHAWGQSNGGVTEFATSHNISYLMAFRGS